jgi:CHAD domain-containing protein
VWRRIIAEAASAQKSIALDLRVDPAQTYTKSMAFSSATRVGQVENRLEHKSPAFSVKVESMDRPLGCPGPDGFASSARALRLVASDGEFVGPRRHPTVSVKATRLAFSPEDSLDEVVACILGDCLDHFVANIPALRDSGDAEAVHQSRVALRRLRALLGLLKRFAPGNPELTTTAARAKVVARELGGARDWHVLREGLERGPREYLRDEPGFFTLLDAVELHRLRAVENARLAIAAPPTQRFVRDLRGFIARRAWRTGSKEPKEAGSAKAFAAKSLQRLHKRAVKRCEGVAALAPEQRHEARIALKKARYAAEFFESLFSQKAARAYLRGLATIQDQLGEENDRATAARLLGEIAADDASQETLRALCFLRGWRAGAQQRGALVTKESERRLRRLKPFWL